MKLNVFCAALLLSTAVSANAFQAAPGGPAPGSGNASASASSNREENASYNRVIGSGVKNKVANDDRRAVKIEKPVPATAADIVPGSPLRDVQGAAFAKVESLDGDSAIVAAGERKVRVPLIAFGKDKNGLLLGITAAKFQELASKAQ